MDESTRKSISYLVNEIRNNPDDDIVEIFEEAFCGKGLTAEWVDETPYEIEVRIVGDQVQSYQKYEFCEAMKCSYLDAGPIGCHISDGNCVYAAKEFHSYLTENGFEIVRREE